MNIFINSSIPDDKITNKTILEGYYGNVIRVIRNVIQIRISDVFVRFGAIDSGWNKRLEKTVADRYLQIQMLFLRPYDDSQRSTDHHVFHRFLCKSTGYHRLHPAGI